MLSAREVEDLKAVALSLPLDWCYVMEFPFGQMSIQPLREVKNEVLGLIASRESQSVRRWRFRASDYPAVTQRHTQH